MINTDNGNMNHLNGLTSEQAADLQRRFGKNELASAKKGGFIRKIFAVLGEPMFLLLLAAAIIYFVLGEPHDAAVMLSFVVVIISIDVFQEWKTDRTLNALKDLSAPRITVIRDGREQVVASADLVPGDLMMVSEGVKIPADGEVIRASDFRVDESTLTGEAEGVWKVTIGQTRETAAPAGRKAGSEEGLWRQDYCYAGTLVVQGSAVIRVDRIGAATEFGKIGAGIASAPDTPTPLQRQTRQLVKMCAVIAILLCILVGVITYFNTAVPDFRERVIDSILAGITLAMAMIPEEFPVILTVFLSMGAWRLARKHSLVRRLPSVETLGEVSVLCVDKTGTITLNQMTVQDAWAVGGDVETLCEVMGLACEPDTYDPMEKAMLEYCDRVGYPTTHLFGGELLQEYAFTHELKMMGHVWNHDNELIIAAKGSPESIFSISLLDDSLRLEAARQVARMSDQALRVIAVGLMKPANNAAIPASLGDCTLKLCGLIGLADPPRESVRHDIQKCSRAGVRVVMITGDYGATAGSIARQIGIPGDSLPLSGADIDHMDDAGLREQVSAVSVFSRVVPEHKLRIVKALKETGAIVAMTGDGVNDAPALKYADIGIAMGQRGSEVAREAADLILMDDNFSTIVDTIEDGRRIYDNIRKAVGYVFTIHLPIAGAALLAPLLKAEPASLLLLPVHVVLLELIIDPTCSIVLERQPAEHNIMDRPPRSPGEYILDARTLLKAVIQGLTIFAGSFGAYFWFLQQNPSDAALARSMGIAVIMLANVMLVQVNSSNYDSMIHSMFRLAGDRVMWAASLGTAAGLLLILYTPLAAWLKLAPLTPGQLLLAALMAAVSVLWYEIVKLVRRKGK